MEGRDKRGRRREGDGGAKSVHVGGEERKIVVWMRSWGVRGRDGLSSMVGRSREGKVRSLRWWRREGRKRDELRPSSSKRVELRPFASFPSTPSPSLLTVHPVSSILILWICSSTSCPSLPQSAPASASTAPFSSSLLPSSSSFPLVPPLPSISLSTSTHPLLITIVAHLTLSPDLVPSQPCRLEDF